MPELPEVETVKEGLKKKLLGRKIIGCQVRWDKIIEYPDKENFIKEIANNIVSAKYKSFITNVTIDRDFANFH